MKPIIDIMLNKTTKEEAYEKLAKFERELQRLAEEEETNEVTKEVTKEETEEVATSIHR